jgi:uncharacterized protein (TIGR00730 family)
MRQLKEKDLEKIVEKDFRVAIFGSARIKPGEKAYENVFDLAKMIGERGYDIITGGGPGLMEAANGGHSAGDKEQKAKSIGLTIHLSTEEKANDFVEMRRQFERFAERLETFTKLSNVFVVTPGGIGTMLELFYTWQLVQVKKVDFKPIILSGEMWKPLIYWIIDYALKERLISSEDFDYVYITKDNKETMELIDTFNKQYKEKGKCWPIKIGKK